MIPLSQKQLHSLLSSLQDEDDYIFFDSSRSDGENCTSLLFLHPNKRLECFPGDDPELFLLQMQAALDQGHYLAGWMGYEFAYLLEPDLFPLSADQKNSDTPLASFAVFSEPFSFDHRTGENSFPHYIAEDELPDFQVTDLVPSHSREKYLKALHKIKEYIAAGDTYQVNYTLKLLFQFSGSPEAFYQTLRCNQSVAYGALLHLGGEHILSFSPELFFRVTDDSIAVRPMKGTMKRGRYMEEDEAFCQALSADSKNRSENVMIVDLLRNDLGHLMRTVGDAKVVTDSLFDVERYESLLQMTSSIHAKTESSLLNTVPFSTLFRTLFPCGSVTGAPKIRTMEIIRELEKGPRGVYTGAIGYFAPEGKAVFNVPIRTIRLTDGRGEMGIGSGIVYDSDPVQEWNECLLKGHFLTRPVSDFYLIETLLYESGKGYWLLVEHLNRLRESAKFFCFNYDEDRIQNTLKRVSGGFADGCTRLRLTLNKDGSIKTDFQSCEQPKMFSLPIKPGKPNGQLPTIRLSEKQVDSSSSWYFHKTSKRDLFQNEYAKSQQEKLFDICFLNERKELTEGCITNIVLYLDGEYVTPSVSSGLLAGTMRQKLLFDEVAIKERIVTSKDLLRAEAVFCCNSIRGIQQVRIVT